jgi:hypothetical protein
MCVISHYYEFINILTYVLVGEVYCIDHSWCLTMLKSYLHMLSYNNDYQQLRPSTDLYSVEYHPFLYKHLI